jgi:hypothetical protein
MRLTVLWVIILFVLLKISESEWVSKTGQILDERRM